MPMIITRANASAKGFGFAGVSKKGTYTNPGVSAKDIQLSGVSTNGWYYIKTSTMTTPKLVYCNMTDNGGGWMLVAYNANSFSASPAGNPIPNQWANGQGTFPTNSYMLANINDLWFNNGSPQCINAMRMKSPNTQQIPILANMDVAYYVVYASGAFQFPATGFNPTSYTLNSGNGINLTWYNLKGYTQMTGPLSSNAPIDWMYNTGSSYYYTICGPSSNVQTDGRSGSGAGTGSWTNSKTNDLYGLLDVDANTTSASGQVTQTYAVYIR